MRTTRGSGSDLSARSTRSPRPRHTTRSYARPESWTHVAVHYLTDLKALESGDMKEKLLNAGLDPVSSTPEELPAFMRKEQERYAAVIRNANIKVEP